MGKIRRGGYVFIYWKGDHTPKHVHIFKNERPVATWNLDGGYPISGKVNRKLRKIVATLLQEGKLK